MFKKSMFQYSVFFYFLITLWCCAESSNKVDLIVFSYNRPMQLYALLESVDYYITGLEKIHVVCRVDNDQFRQAYQQVKSDFNDVIFHYQGNNPHKDFKQITEALLLQPTSNYVLFAVDDIIVKDYLDLQECTIALQQTKAYGFYLRLGTNLTECYMLRCSQTLPPLKLVKPTIYSWIIKEGLYDWGYSNTVDMTLYKKSDILQTIQSLFYWSPNSLESLWSRRSVEVNRRKGLCFEQSKIVNIPVNLVNKSLNRYMEGLTAEELLVLFNRGLKIDIASLYKINNKGAHMDYELKFLPRTKTIFH